MKSPVIIPRLIRALLLLCFLLSTFSVYSQNRKELEQKRKQLLVDIQKADQLLQTTTRSKRANLSRLKTLQNQIRKREQLILTLREEITNADSVINRTDKVVNALELDLDNLEKEYGEIARQAYRQKVTGNKLFFIFSADGFNQAFKRWQYLRQYEDFREKQAALMVSTRETLRLKVDQLERQRSSKQELINTTEQQKNLLQKERNDKNEIVQSLQKDEQKLKSELATKRRSHESLNKAIEDVIQKEIMASRRKARTPDALKKKKNTTSGSSTRRENESPSRVDRTVTARLAQQFRNNKGRLGWPVNNGVVTGRFGKQPHPTLKRIQITNNGIDIQTKPGEKVFAVFNGEIAGVQYIPGNHYMVIIKHGTYYTVYSNLETVEVKKGETVSTREVIGHLHIDQASNTSEVHFEVWKNKTRMNPVRWIR
ncbi:MAG: murein hydrolase activator EnvC [Saprospiraceae bacterium]